MKLLTLGKILKTKGLDGTVKIASSTDFAETRYQQGNKVFLFNEKTNEIKEVTVSSYYFHQGNDYVSFEEYPTIEAITPFINWSICIDKNSLPELGENEYYFCDLEECDVYENDVLVGKVKLVEDYNGRKLLRIARKNKSDLLLPFVNAFIKDVDIKAKRIDVKLIEGM